MGTRSRGPGVARLVLVAHEPDGRQTEIPAFAGMTWWRWREPARQRPDRLAFRATSGF